MAPWQTTDFPHGAGTVIAEFSVRADGPIWRAQVPATADGIPTAAPYLCLAVRDGHLTLTARSLSPDPADPNAQSHVSLDIEDAFGLDPGTIHEAALTFGAFGTRIYLDGYQCFACAGNLNPSRVHPSGAFDLGSPNAIACNAFLVDPVDWDAVRIAEHAAAAKPDIVFASDRLSPRDTDRIALADAGSVHARFRLRGRGQHGTILAAGVDGSERMTVAIGAGGLTLAMRDESGAGIACHAPGHWDDGGWHDLAIRSSRGAVDLFMDGVSVLHQPGQMWFADLAGPRHGRKGIDAFTVGRNIAGVRLMGEVSRGGLYVHALTDGQIARLAHTPPMVTTALFDAGYAGSASYRIPSLIRTVRGTLIAGADQRTAISNDAPNHINFVIRRSTDGGRNWMPMQTVIDMPGREDGLDGASAIDSCSVVDRSIGRITVLIDLNPGGIGLTNCERGIGVNRDGVLRLRDAQGNETTLDAVADAGDVWRSPMHADPSQRWHAVPTCYIAQIHSDDDGETWSPPFLIDAMVKEEWMHFMGVCPGTGIQLDKGPYAGRLLMPFYCSGQSRTHYSGGALISDDGGETWRCGRMINEGREINGTVVDPATMRDDDATTSETTFVQRADGDVVAFFRNQHASGRVGKAVSHDGGDTWDELEFDPALPEIFSQPNALAVPQLGTDAVLFANASQMMPYRGRGMVRLSEDGGRTWTGSLCVHPHHHVYQCMAICETTHDVECEGSQLGLLWEIETTGVYITHIPLAWFSHGHDKGVAANHTDDKKSS